jgi:sulfate adenylyltransferase
MSNDVDPIAPHGGTLVNLQVTGPGADALSAEAINIPRVAIGERELSDLEMLATGALSPLSGFQTEDDYHAVLETMHLSNGLAWAIPVVLGLSDADAHRIGGASSIALTSGTDAPPLAVLRVTERFKRDKPKEALAVYRTDDLEHPGVKALFEAGDTCVAGSLEVLSLPHHADFTNYRLTPAETREALWVVA